MADEKINNFIDSFVKTIGIMDDQQGSILLKAFLTLFFVLKKARCKLPVRSKSVLRSNVEQH